MGSLPTAEQLSLIAAALARNRHDYPDTLAKKAMEIWLAARKQIFLADFGDSIGMQNRQWNWDKVEGSSSVFEDPFAPTFLPTDEYPVSRDQFLQRMLAKSKKNRTFDLARTAKAYVRDTLRKRTGKDPTQDEISDAYGRWKNYENADQANAGASHFRQWYPYYIKQVRSASGKKSAVKKAEKKAKLELEAAEKAGRDAKALKVSKI